MALRNIEALVVDDHRLPRDLIAEVLKALNANVRHAEDGGEAFDLIVRKPPHLVITDLQMPLDGIGLLHNVRRSPRCPDHTLPVIAMTSLTDRTTVCALRDAGADEVISKPFSVRIVLERVAAVIEHPREFIRTPRYVGPCRRRRSDAAYQGPRRRASDKPHLHMELD
jgi:two-component system chemotaxis response regulator CheY